MYLICLFAAENINDVMAIKAYRNFIINYFFHQRTKDGQGKKKRQCEAAHAGSIWRRDTKGKPIIRGACMSAY